MTYEPTIWKDGDLVTSAKLNKLEQGVANGGGTLIVNLSSNETPSIVGDKTAGEIYEAFRNGNVRFILESENDYEDIMNLLACSRTSKVYSFVSIGNNDSLILYAATADDYPTTEAPELNDGDIGMAAI